MVATYMKKDFELSSRRIITAYGHRGDIIHFDTKANETAPVDARIACFLFDEDVVVFIEEGDIKSWQKWFCQEYEELSIEKKKAYLISLENLEEFINFLTRL